MAEIRLAKLRKEFKETVAVQEMDLDIKEGEFLVLVGPSGCGKTTTLRMIAGLEEATSGEIYIDGRPANDLEPGQRNIGMVFQNLALFPHKTVYENIAFGPRVKGVPAAQTRELVTQVAGSMRIGHLLGKLPAQCSGGEAQRVALARTLVTNPSAFLLDEPLSNLDAKLRKEMRAEIDALHSRVAKTFIYVTHDQEEATSGDISIDGRPANDLEPSQRNIGMVFQNLALFPHKTVYENIAFGPRMKHVPAAERRTRVEQVARTMHIGHLLAKLPAQCSGGEAQRVALARTLVTDPSAFLLDEPLSNLDAKLRKEMRAEIDALHSRVSRTFIYVTHDQEEAMTLADRIVVMRDGRIEQVGTPMEIYYEPTNQFVASFFGSPAMNLIAGEVRRKPGGSVFAFGGSEIPLDGVGEIPAGPVTLGVRPEGMRLDGVVGGHPARVTLVEPLGK